MSGESWGVQRVRWMRLAVVGLLALVGPGGCAARATQFHDFAVAGGAYVKASNAVLDEAATAAVRADTAVMIGARAGTPEGERGSRLIASDRRLQERMLILRDIGRHGRQLQRYFEALADLADSKAPEAAAKAAESAFHGLASLSQALEHGVPTPAVPAATKLVVGAFKAKALEHELRARADAIASELALQEAVFNVVAQQMKVDLGVRLNATETHDVIAPYAASATLPKDWAATREQYLKSVAASSSVDAAARAAQSMRAGFAKVVEKRFDRSAFNSLLDEIGQVVTVAEELSR